MNCKKAEKLFLRAHDGLLSGEEYKELEDHINGCPLCQKSRAEYQNIFEVLQKTDFPEPKPYFWERLHPRLKEQKTFELWQLWKQWGLRAVPLSLLLVLFLASAILFFGPQPREEFSQSGVLLFEDQSPLQDTGDILDQEGVEDKNMMLIFASLEEQPSSRRPIP
ncbi:MAG: zf-HC2 domain-containing protein [Candidatus Aminicenantes bacterium]|nr:zf-HC2 domain-containing protein [Candidatus Aminicenantes bacterium]